MKRLTIFTRTACFGGWVTEKKFGNDQKTNYFNQQKVRADLFLDFVDKKASPPQMKKNLKKWLRPECFGNEGVYLQTELLDWLKQNIKPDLFVLDNYSELVDKRFSNKEGHSFCGLYGHFNSNFIESLTDEGLLDNVHETYDQFFSYIKNHWNVPIIFIHFPTTFDPREKYKIQGEKITAAMEIMASKYGIQNLHADLESIEQRDSDYYHLADKTVNNVVSKIKI